MSSATVQPMQLGMASGGRSRLNWSPPRVCRPSQYMRRPDTMHPRNELPRIAALLLLIFCASFAVAQQGQAVPQANRQSQAQPPAAQAQSGAGGVHREGTDSVLVDANGVPLEDQSGKSIPQTTEEAAVPTSPPRNVPGSTVNIPSKSDNGEAQRTASGGYLYKAYSQEVVLRAT